MKKPKVTWVLAPDLAAAYIKILTRAAALVDTKGRGTKAALRALAEAVAEGRSASPMPKRRTPRKAAP